MVTVRLIRLAMIAATLIANAWAYADEEPRKLEGNRPQRVSQRDDGRVMLFPESAEIFGEELRIAPSNFCLAWWSKENDYAAWDIDLKKAGEYEVWLEWSISDEWAGNPVEARIADQKVEAKIEKSGGWTEFRREKLGIVKLAAGANRLELRAGGPINGEIADVRSVTLNPVGAEPPPAAPEMPPKSPAESLRSMRIHPSMQIELVAAEPLVEDPIAIAWGADLRLWVVEMGDYPLGVDGRGGRGGRIKYLEDVDQYGRYDKATLFLDNLGFPTGVLPYKKGVLVACAPDIFYAEDTDGDGVADVRETLFTGFPERNQQHRVNGLRWGLDNWIHCANGDGGVGGETKITSVATGEQIDLGSRDFRFRPDTGAMEAQSGPTQFGRNQDDWGNWFGSNNGQPLYHFAIDEHYLSRNDRLTPPDPRVHQFGVGGPFFAQSPAIAFHGQPQSLVAGIRETGMGGACSGVIYRDSLLGEDFLGNAFVCDPVTNLVHRRVLTRQGTSFASSRAADESDREFFASTDPWTRPTMVQAGPDGALYLVDMYRLYIEHPQWIHEALLARADLRAGSDRGRIYRIYPRSAHPRAAIRLDRLDTPALVKSLESPSGWQRDTAQRLLVERRDRKAIRPLEAMAASAGRPQARRQALATLAGMDAVSEAVLLKSLNDKHPGVQRLAIQLTEPRLNQSTKLGTAVAALLESPDEQVVLQVAYSLGEWNSPQAGVLLGELIAARHDDPFLVAAALSSATKQPAAVLTAYLAASETSSADRTAEVVRCCFEPGNQAFETAILKELAAPSDKATARPFIVLSALLDAGDVPEATRERFLTAGRPLIERARELAGDSEAPESVRAAALRALARESSSLSEDVGLLAEQVSSAVPLGVAEAAVERLSHLNGAVAGEALAERLTQLTPALRNRAVDALLSRPEWTLSLLKQAKAEASVLASLDVARRQRLAEHSSPEVQAAAKELFGATPSTDRAEVIARYVAPATAQGDAERGRLVFKTNCAACHRLEDVGSEVGPNLAGVKDKSPQALLTAILDPNRAVEDKFLGYNALTVDGKTFSGLVQVESGSSLTLVTGDGRAHVLLRRDLESLVSTGRSFMPEGLEKAIEPAAMNDLLTYLTAVGAGSEMPSPAEAIAANEQGVVELTARQAALHGQKVGVNEQAGCIAWMTEGERAEWNIRLTEPGEYEVQIEWAQVDENADNPFAIAVGESALTGAFPSTHGWDRYQTKVFGRLTLPAGQHTLTLQPNGPVKSELADIRQIRLVRQGDQ